MNAFRQWGWSSRIALGGVILTAVLAAATTWSAWRVDPLPRPVLIDDEPVFVAPGQRSEAVPMSTLLSAVAHDPFRSDRTASPNRYRLPGEALPAPARAATATTRPPYAGATLVGTIVRGDRRLAVVKLPRRDAQMLRIGETFEGLELVSVERRIITLQGPDTTLVLALPGPPSGTASPASDTTGTSPDAAGTPHADGADR